MVESGPLFWRGYMASRHPSGHRHDGLSTAQGTPKSSRELTRSKLTRYPSSR